MIVFDLGSSSTRSASSSGGMRMAPAMASCMVAYEVDDTTSRMTASPDLASAKASSGEMRRSESWELICCSDKLPAPGEAVAVLIPDLTWMQDTALSVAALAAVLGLANVLLGLFSVITG